VFLDRKEYSGDLFSQLEQTETFIKNHIHLRGEINGLQRTDTYELPETALREALVNAVVHRDYTNQGRDIKVGVYDDLVNIVSPGGFPSTLTAETLLDGRSEIRNRVIAHVFKELGYIEQWGSGIQRIKAACLAQGLAEPQIREKGDFVDVEFYRPVPDTTAEVPDSIGKVSDSIGKVPDSTGYRRIVPDSLTLQEREIILYLEQHERITTLEVEKLLSVKQRRARELLKGMTEKKLLEKQGSARSTYYVRAEV